MAATLVAGGESRDREVHGAYLTVEQIKQANRDAGSHFFDADTMRFFRSRVASGTYGGRIFVTSEQNSGLYGESYPRMYTVREAMPDGSIEEIGEFQEYTSLGSARTAAKAAAKAKHTYYFDGQHGKGGRKVTYVVTEADDPWHALESLRKNFRIRHCGRARDYMLPGGQHADSYVHLTAKS